VSAVPSKQNTFKRPLKIVQGKRVDCQIFRKAVPRRRSGVGEWEVIQAERSWVSSPRADGSMPHWPTLQTFSAASCPRNSLLALESDCLACA